MNFSVDKNKALLLGKSVSTCKSLGLRELQRLEASILCVCLILFFKI